MRSVARRVALTGTATALALAATLPLPMTGHGPMAVALTTCSFDAATASSTDAGSSASNAIDGNPTTAWRSGRTSSATAVASLTLTMAAGSDPAAALRITAAGGGFAVDQRVSEGVAVVRSDDALPAPAAGRVLVLPLTDPIVATATVTATELRQVAPGIFGLDLAEIEPVCDPALDDFVYLGGGGTSSAVSLDGVGSGAFDPAKLINFVPDSRSPLIDANPGAYRNIYAPNIVKDGDEWKVYFGGWDGEPGPPNNLYDATYLTTTEDFRSFTPHEKVFAPNPAEARHANNPSVVKIGPGQWHLHATTQIHNLAYSVIQGIVQTDFNFVLDSPAQGRTGWAKSTDGRSWGSFGVSKLVNMTGYAPVPLVSSWERANVNAGNTLYYEDGVYHLYFDDLEPTNNPPFGTGIFHATSTDGINYTYVGRADANETTKCQIPMDFKKFDTPLGRRYLFVGGCPGGASVAGVVSSSKSAFPPTSTLFTPTQPNAAPGGTNYGVGLVTDGNRLLGMLNSGAIDAEGTQGRIWANWLQKALVLRAPGGASVGTGVAADGPDACVVSIPVGADLTDAALEVKDSDGTTAVASSPVLTLRPGDRFALAGA